MKMNIESQVQMLAGEVSGLRERVSRLGSEISALHSVISTSSLNDQDIIYRLDRILEEVVQQGVSEVAHPTVYINAHDQNGNSLPLIQGGRLFRWICGCGESQSYFSNEQVCRESGLEHQQSHQRV